MQPQLPNFWWKRSSVAIEHQSTSYLIEELISYLVLYRMCAGKYLNIKKVNTSGYHPQTDGSVERFNSTLINMLSKCAEKNGIDWDKQLPYVLFAYRATIQESTKESPFYLLYGRDPRLPSECALTIPTSPAPTWLIYKITGRS